MHVVVNTQSFVHQRFLDAFGTALSFKLSFVECMLFVSGNTLWESVAIAFRNVEVSSSSNIVLLPLPSSPRPFFLAVASV